VCHDPALDGVRHERYSKNVTELDPSFLRNAPSIPKTIHVGLDLLPVQQVQASMNSSRLLMGSLSFKDPENQRLMDLQK